MRALFSVIFPSSLTRVAYTIRLIACTVTVALVFYFAGFGDTVPNLALFLIWTYTAFFVIRPRAREAGMRQPFIVATLALVPLFFPFLSIALIFRPPDYHFRDVRG